MLLFLQDCPDLAAAGADTGKGGIIMSMGPGMGRMGRGFLTEEEKANRPKVTKALLRRIFSYLLPYWKQLLLVMLCIAVSSALSLYPSILTGRIIDEGLIGRDLNMLIRLIILSLLVTLCANLIGVAESYLNTWIAQHITFDMRNAMFRHLQQMSQRFFTTNSQGDIITRMTSDIDGVRQVITNTFTSILSNSITLMIALIAMFRKNWILALIGIVIVPLFTIPTRRAGRTRWELTRESQECNDNINGILNETLSVSGQMLVKLFNREEKEYRKYEAANQKMIDLNIRESMAGRWFRVTMSTFSSIGPMLLYLVGGILIMNYDSSLSVGDITVLVSLLGRMYGPVNSLLNIQVDWIRSMALFTRLFEYYDMPVEIKNDPQAVILENPKGNIEFDHVSKGFGDKLLIEDLSFVIPQGAIVGVIGPNGAGKSTLFRMITGKQKPDSGTITIGPTVKIAAVDQLRTALPNEKTVFEAVSDGLDVIQVGKFEMSSRAYLGRFNFKGQDQQKRVGDLSGGERGRLHLAKTLLAGGNVLLLDEPSNDLDVETLRALEDALLEFPGCAMVTSHDRWFLDRIATHILAFEGDSKVVFFAGNYQEYEADKRKRLGEEAARPHRLRFKPLKH